MSESWAQQSLQKNRETDDVFRNEFLQAVLFISELASVIQVEKPALKYLTDIGVTWIGTMTGKTGLQAGPHIELGDTLTPVLRVFDDTHGAFLHALMKDEKGFGFFHTSEPSATI